MTTGGEKEGRGRRSRIRRHGRTEVMSKTRAAIQRVDHFGRGLQVVEAADRCNNSATITTSKCSSTPVFPSPRFIPRFLFLFPPYLTITLPASMLPFLHLPSIFSLLVFSPVYYVRVSPFLFHPSVILCPSSSPILLLFSPTTFFQPSRILATMYYARTNRATYIGLWRVVGATLFRARHPLQTGVVPA